MALTLCFKLTVFFTFIRYNKTLAENYAFCDRTANNWEEQEGCANKSHVSIRVSKNFGNGTGRGRPRKCFLASTLITMQTLVAVSHAVSPVNFGDIDW